MAYRRYAGATDYGFSREANDDQLRKAISYLAHEGKNDATATYVDRIQIIDDAILKLFPAEGRSYNPRLYRQLRSLVRELQSDIERVDEEGSFMGLDSDYSTDDIYSPEALYRGQSPVEYPDLRTPRLDKAEYAPLPSERDVNLRERMWLYGGPKNDVEQWFKEFPAVLAFGENPYLERWESMKIKFDLAESAKRSAKGANPIVTTTVPYSAVEQLSSFVQQNIYDTGSRFKLPEELSEELARALIISRKDRPIDHAAKMFNEGGGGSAEKDYVPRLALPQVDMHRVMRPSGVPPPTFGSSKSRGKEPVRSSSVPPRGAGPSAARNTNRYGTINPEVHADIHQRQQRAQASLNTNDATGGPSAPRRTQQPTQTLSPKLKRFHALVEESKGHGVPVRSTPPSKSASGPSRGGSVPMQNLIQRLSHVDAGPSKRGPGRPRKNTVDPTYRPSDSPPTPSKRKRHVAPEDDDTQAPKKPKVTKKAVSAKKASPKSAVKEAAAAKRSKPAKSTVKKPVTSTTAVPTPRPGSASKGTIRSGTTYKPAGRKSPGTKK